MRGGGMMGGDRTALAVTVSPDGECGPDQLGQNIDIQKRWGRLELQSGEGLAWMGVR